MNRLDQNVKTSNVWSKFERKMEEGHRHEIRVDCEHCKEPFVVELVAPIAVRCSHCDAVFDARLQLERKTKS